MTTIAELLRRIAEWLDPQPFTIELLQVSGPVEDGLNDLRGFPAYYWKTDNRSFSLYPIPDGEFRVLMRRGDAA